MSSGLMPKRFLTYATLVRLLFAYVSVMSSAVFAQVAQNDAIQLTVKNNEGIVFDPAVIDFGSRYASETVVKTVSLVNTSTREARIRSILDTCGCSVTEVEKKVLAPSESIPVNIRISLKGRTGPQRMAVHVRSDLADYAISSLVMTGAVLEDIRLNPPRLLMAPNVDGDGLVGDVQVKAMDDVPFVLEDLQGLPEEWQVSVDPQADAHAYRVTLSTAHELNRDYEFELTLLTDHPHRPSLQLPVMVRTTTILSRPSLLRLVSDAPAIAPAPLTVFSQTSTPFEIEELTLPPALKATTRRLSDHVYQISLEITGAISDLKDGSLEIKASTGEMIEVPIIVASPLSNRARALPAGGKPVLEVPAIDAASLRERDRKAARTEKILRFAEPFETHAKHLDYGEWKQVEANRARWTLHLHAPGSKNISVAFADVSLPEGSTLRLFSSNGAEDDVSLSRFDITDARQLWTPALSGERVTIEVEMDVSTLDQFALSIVQINRGYRRLAAE